MVGREKKAFCKTRDFLSYKRGFPENSGKAINILVKLLLKRHTIGCS